MISAKMSSMAEKIDIGMDAFIRRIEEKKRSYRKLLKFAQTSAKRQGAKNNKVIRITDPVVFHQTIKCFGAALDAQKAEIDLKSIYEIGIHQETGALIIANKGATLYSLSPKSKTPYIVRHIGCCVYVPGLGIEFVNVGLVGDVYNGNVVLRSESACSPSFLFGSQRCNCAHQWDSIREVAAQFNPISPPKTGNGKAFERWVQGQCSYEDGKHLFKKDGPGFILLHVDTQNGMGSGYSEDEFSFDLYTRASMRHRGEYSSEQTAGVSMAGGFKALGLRPDPRQENEQIGYQITRIILDFLGTSESLIFLTNNPFKLKSLNMNGYRIERVMTIGAVNAAGSQEAEERGSDFDHLDIDGTSVSFEEEISRLKEDIGQKIQNHERMQDNGKLQSDGKMQGEIGE